MRVLLFAQVREIVGADHIEISIEDGKSTISAQSIKAKVIEAVKDDASFGALLESCMVAIDNMYAMDVTEEINVSDSTEVAIIPPVSGG